VADVSRTVFVALLPEQADWVRPPEDDLTASEPTP
jgi:hypothetical protein